MADFPSTNEARERAYVITGPPASALALQTCSVQYFHGNISTNRPITFVFTYCSLARAQAISNHYTTEGSWGEFKIPIELLKSHPTLYDLTPASQNYRYLAPPDRQPVGGGLFDVTVQLETII